MSVLLHCSSLSSTIADIGRTGHDALREPARKVHVLILTATPILRTLLLGLQDLSVIATLPVQRRPIRTVLAPYDDATVRQALARERGRRGQSFVVRRRVRSVEA